MALNIVITMAGLGSRFIKAGYIIPKYMIEVKNNSLFYHSLNSLPCEIAKQVIFIALQEHENKFNVKEFIKSECKKLKIKKIKIILIPEITKGQSETALVVQKYINNDEEILIYNIDTAFESSTLKTYLLSNDCDGYFGVFTLNSKDDKWSFAKIDNNGIIVETAEKIQISNYASTGLYHFTKAKDFYDVAKSRIENELKEANEYYIAPLYNDLIKKNKKFKLDIASKFIPLGTPEDVEKFKNMQDFKQRSFNNFIVNKENGTLIKTSYNETKLKNEIEWFLKLPENLKQYTKKIYSYSLINPVFYETEFLQNGYTDLSNIFINDKLNISHIKQILNTIGEFHSIKNILNKESFIVVYYNKLKKRLQQLKEQNVYFKNLLEKETIKINNVEYRNIAFFEKDILNKIEELYNENDCGIIHGDYFFANMLYNGQTKDLKLIDPRGEWEYPTIYGDIKYDIAKLSHSINGKYDFIVNDKFELKYNENSIDFKIIYKIDLNKEFEELIKIKYNLEQIKFIESLLFLSMLPLHNDNLKRQIVMFAIGLKLLNETIKE
jgi:dTDP-glucose pyrophosphorylase